MLSIPIYLDEDEEISLEEAKALQRDMLVEIWDKIGIMLTIKKIEQEGDTWIGDIHWVPADVKVGVIKLNRKHEVIYLTPEEEISRKIREHQESSTS